MSLLSFRKKKKEEKEEEKEEERKEEKRPEVSEEKPKTAHLKAEFSSILLRPYLTEKTKKLAEKGQYVFEVLPKANKTLVKQAVENIYQVKVEKVRMINLPSKRKRWGFTYGKKRGIKKAVVILSPGQKLDIFPQ